MRLLLLFGILFPSALLLEGGMMLIYRIPLKGRNVLLLLCATLLTQTVLTLTAGRALISSGPMGAFFILFLAGFVLMVAKGLVYEQFLTAPHSKRALSYGIFAGLASWAAFAATLVPLNGFLQRFG
ncbi:MAG: hypothetical protein LBI19_03305 [Oscillospiraceae bacterium]|jgi:hypothetical protein|nr:hypothetical protein [Oscillospiraceae bacterium]